MNSSSTEVTEEGPLRSIIISKVVLNMGVGKSGEPLERAKEVLQELTGRKPRTNEAKQTIRDFGIHRGEPIGVSVTLRGQMAHELLHRIIAAKDRRLPSTSFDKYGSCSFGVKEHIDIPNIKYRPEIGIFGMDVSVVLERPGFRIMRRRRATSRVGRKHRTSRDDVIRFFQERLGVEVYDV